MSSNVVIEAKNLHKSFGRIAAVTDVSVEVKSGQATAMVGPNGAGKSTVIHLVAGLLRPSSGEVLVSGREPRSIAGRVGVLFEDPNLYPHLTGHRNLDILTRGRLESRELLSDNLAILGLSDDILRRKAKALSFGQRRRVTLAALFALDAPILLVDEPTNGLDAEGMRACVELFGRAKERAKTILMTGQNLKMLDQVADAVLAVNSGSSEVISDWRSHRSNLPGLLQLQTKEADRITRMLQEEGLAHSYDQITAEYSVAGEESHLRQVLSRIVIEGITVSNLRLREGDLTDVARREITEGPIA